MQTAFVCASSGLVGALIGASSVRALPAAVVAAWWLGRSESVMLLLGGLCAHAVLPQPKQRKDEPKDDAAHPAAPVVRMHAWTLAFSDAALEGQYTTERFGTACAPLIFFLGFGMTMNVIQIVVYGTIAGFASFFVCCGAVLALRLWLDNMDDQQRARALFGRSVNVGIAIAWSVLLPWLHFHPQQPSAGAGSVLIASLVFCLSVVYFRISAMATDQRLTYVVMNVLGCLHHPPWSLLGRPSETLCCWVGLLLGELGGFTLDTYLRSVWLQLIEVKERERLLQEREVLLRSDRIHSLARERIHDVCFEFYATEWTKEGVRNGRVAHATPSFRRLFGTEPSDRPGF